MITIGAQTLDQGSPAFIIAEAGVNHDGDVGKALALVDAAARVGADAVKFQAFRADELVTASAPTAEYQRRHTGVRTQQELLARLELDDSAWEKLRDRAARHRIEFLATPFSEASVQRLIRLGTPALKIASTDLTNRGLLAAVMESGKPIILSTGAALEGEIRETVQFMERGGALGRLIILHCVSAYPTPLATANLRAISTLSRTFGLPAGLSDHTLSTQTGSWAVCAGACVLEKHLTLDRHASGPDHAMSLDPKQFAEYVRCVRSAESALGSGALGFQPVEADVRTAARRSLVATRDIPRNSVVTRDMLTFKRPGGGIDPADVERLLGRRVRRDIAFDTTLLWDMVQ